MEVEVCPLRFGDEIPAYSLAISEVQRGSASESEPRACYPRHLSLECFLSRPRLSAYVGLRYISSDIWKDGYAKVTDRAPRDAPVAGRTTKVTGITVLLADPTGKDW
jgi:hypothetical protein